jgi:hypothetical protein
MTQNVTKYNRMALGGSKRCHETNTGARREEAQS